jgi:diguanylate cyclase
MSKRRQVATKAIFFAMRNLLCRPEWMVFLPAITLAAFWLGGEAILVLTAVGLPLAFAAAGAFQLRSDHSRPASGLSLHNHIVDKLNEILREQPYTGKMTACLVVQFDGAEQLLDRHGRAAEMTVLIRSAERICAVLRDGDAVARLEGGGFAVALSPMRRLDTESVVQLAARLQTAVATPIEIDAARLYVTCSVGFCLSDHGQSG